MLSLLKPKSYGFRGLDAGGDWALTFASAEGVKCYAIHSGACWIELEENRLPTQLKAGDLILLPGRSAFRLYSSSDVEAIDAYKFFPLFPAGNTAVLNGGGCCSGVGGFFDFQGLHTDMLLGMLPPIIHIRAETTRAALGWFIERLMRELRAAQPGGALIASHLAQIILIEALRLPLDEAAPHSAGWLFALSDRQIRPVMVAMHLEPERRWTLHELARVAGMSRSSFAVRFRRTVGETVMDYLTRWRMLLAADRLAHEDASISVVASAVGYASESAFGAAFKRVIGHSPRQFAKAVSSA